MYSIKKIPTCLLLLLGIGLLWGAGCTKGTSYIFYEYPPDQPAE